MRRATPKQLEYLRILGVVLPAPPEKLSVTQASLLITQAKSARREHQLDMKELRYLEKQELGEWVSKWLLWVGIPLLALAWLLERIFLR